MDNRTYGHGYRGMGTLGLCIIKEHTLVTWTI